MSFRALLGLRRYATNSQPPSVSPGRRGRQYGRQGLPISSVRYTNVLMARAIWSGAISFGLVNVPVKLYSATSPKTVRFHQISAKTGARIRQKRVDPSTGEE